MKTIKNLTFAALAATLLFQTPITRADDHGPRSITFEKCVVADGSLIGTVAGDCGAGTVVFKYLSVLPGKAIWRFSGEYTITTTPECSFKAVCGGIVDTRTGHVVLNGVVTDGQYLGARVQVRAQANANLTCSSGTMTITPSEPE
jgi:xanthine/CO dehydrogenase XdhC/CoxF family maturation factor